MDSLETGVGAGVPDLDSVVVGGSCDVILIDRVPVDEVDVVGVGLLNLN